MNWNWINPAGWDTNERRAAGRHVLNTVCSVVATLAVVGLVSSSDATTLTTELNKLAHGLGEVVSALAAIAGILGPAYATLRARLSASPDSQVKSVADNLRRNGSSTVPSEARKDIIDAVASMSEVRGVVSPSAADLPNPKVVATAAEVPKLV